MLWPTSLTGLSNAPAGINGVSTPISTGDALKATATAPVSMADTQQYRDMIAQYRAMAAASTVTQELVNGEGSYKQCTACTHRAGLHQYRLGPCKAHIMGEACGCLEFK